MATDRGVSQVVVAVAAAAFGALVWGVLEAQSPPDGPQPIAWDRVACARCRMLVGDPAFSAQLQIRDGRTLDFDDPGCLLLYVDEERPDVHAIWFHHHGEERWIPRREAGFVRVSDSPMGYGLAAVDGSAAEVLSYEEALEHAEKRDAARPEAGL